MDPPPPLPILKRRAICIAIGVGLHLVHGAVANPLDLFPVVFFLSFLLLHLSLRLASSSKFGGLLSGATTDTDNKTTRVGSKRPRRVTIDI